MSLDEHRAPNRLASISPSRTVPSHKPTPITAARPVSRTNRRPERHVEIVDMDERPWNDEPEEAQTSSSPHGSGVQHIDKTPIVPSASEVEFSEELMPPEPRAISSALLKQEQYQMLMQTIQLYCDEWKLATIRSDSKTNRLVAYLVPRNKRIDLKTAMSKQQVLRILIDNKGNIDIQEPPARRGGPFGWFRGS